MYNMDSTFLKNEYTLFEILLLQINAVFIYKQGGFFLPHGAGFHIGTRKFFSMAGLCVFKIHTDWTVQPIPIVFFKVHL